jgi:hypothetical protein
MQISMHTHCLDSGPHRYGPSTKPKQDAYVGSNWDTCETGVDDPKQTEPNERPNADELHETASVTTLGLTRRDVISGWWRCWLVR